MNAGRVEGPSPAAELALDGEGIVSVLEADLAEGDRLTSLLAIAYPQQHGVAVEVFGAMTSDVGQVDAGVSSPVRS